MTTNSARGTDLTRDDQPTARAMRMAVIPFGMTSAGDADGVRAALAQVPLARVRQLAVIAKVEGTATLNDVARELASERIGAEIVLAGGDLLRANTIEILSIGCEGIITPGGWLLASLDPTPALTGGPAAGLVMGHSRSAPLAMVERATRSHILVAARTVRAAMSNAALDPGGVRLVLIKSPILMPTPAAELSEDQRRHVGSTAASRGAAALGVAIALGELSEAAISDRALCSDWSLHATRAMAFSGTETQCCEAVVLGNRLGGDPRMQIRSVTTRDLLDCEPLATLARPGDTVAAIFYKAGMVPGGALRGERTTVFSSELPSDKQLRAAASGIVGAMFGRTRAFVSGGAEHQGQPGGCIAAVITMAAT